MVYSNSFRRSSESMARSWNDGADPDDSLQSMQRWSLISLFLSRTRIASVGHFYVNWFIRHRDRDSIGRNETWTYPKTSSSSRRTSVHRNNISMCTVVPCPTVVSILIWSEFFLMFGRPIPAPKPISLAMSGAVDQPACMARSPFGMPGPVSLIRIWTWSLKISTSHDRRWHG